mgnify:CR=1 FL=1
MAANHWRIESRPYELLSLIYGTEWHSFYERMFKTSLFILQPMLEKGDTAGVASYLDNMADSWLNEIKALPRYLLLREAVTNNHEIVRHMFRIEKDVKKEIASFCEQAKMCIMMYIIGFKSCDEQRQLASPAAFIQTSCFQCGAEGVPARCDGLAPCTKDDCVHADMLECHICNTMWFPETGQIWKR